METLGERIVAARAALGWTQADLADRLGKSYQQVSAWERGDANLRPVNRHLLCRELGIHEQWLTSGKGPMWYKSPDQVSEPLDRPYHSDDPDTILIPLFEARPAAGSGNHVLRERPATALPFSRTWLRSIDLGPQDAAVLKVQGDSMEPALRHGEMVFLDTKAAQEAISAGIWVFSINNQLFVKRLDPRPDGEVLAHSDNPNYSSFSVDLESPSFKLIGRVVWAGRRP